MNPETESKIFIILIVGIIAIICGSVASTFIHLENPLELLEENITLTNNTSDEYNYSDYNNSSYSQRSSSSSSGSSSSYSNYNSYKNYSSNSGNS